MSSKAIRQGDADRIEADNPSTDHHISVEWSDEDGAYIARCATFNLLATHGDTPHEATQEMKVLLRYVLDDMAASGEALPGPRGVEDEQ